jgi:universal stress protein E
MRSIRRILVAIKDPAAPTQPAVAKATQLARALGAELELFHALDSSVYVDLLGTPGSLMAGCEEERRQFLQRLARIAARVRLHGVNAAVAVEWDHPAYEAILRHAMLTRADLIVAEAHVGRHIAPGVIRFADWELLRLSPVPVLLVKGTRPYHRPTVLAAVDPSRAYSKPAKLDEEILGMAATVSEAVRGTLHAVHACEPLPQGLAMIAARTAERVHDAVGAHASLGFDRLLRSTKIPAAHRHLINGHPSDVVQKAARSLRSEIVVLGAMSRSGLERVLIGNTAERLLDRLCCDLLIVKPAEFVNPVPRGRPGVRFLAAQPLA